MLYIRCIQGQIKGYAPRWDLRSLWMIDPYVHPILFHATDIQFLKSIMVTGLIPGGGLGEDQGRDELHLSVLDPTSHDVQEKTSYECFGCAMQPYEYHVKHFEFKKKVKGKATGKATGTGGAAEALAALSTPLALATALDAIGVGGALLDQAWTANPNLTLALT